MDNCGNFQLTILGDRLLKDDIFYKAVIPAWVDLYIADTFISDDYICRVPERQEREIVANRLPHLTVELLRAFAISSGTVDSLVDHLIDLGVTITAAVAARRTRHAGNL